MLRPVSFGRRGPSRERVGPGPRREAEGRARSQERSRGKAGADLGPGVRALASWERGSGPLRRRGNGTARVRRARGPARDGKCTGREARPRRAAAGSLRPVGQSDAVASQGGGAPGPLQRAPARGCLPAAVRPRSRAWTVRVDARGAVGRPRPHPGERRPWRPPPAQALSCSEGLDGPGGRRRGMALRMRERVRGPG